MLVIILSITGFFRLLLSILFFYFLIRLITRWLQISSENRRKENEYKREEGEIVLRFNKKGERINDKKNGDYVDYEEVD